MTRFFRKIHLWAGVPLGLIISVVCLSGAILAVGPLFEDAEGNRPEFFSMMFRLHRWLLDPAGGRGPGLHVGKLTVGISVLLFLVALLSGIGTWWPMMRASLKLSLAIPLHKGSFRFWRGLHVAGGMYTLVFLLIMTVTGLSWSFGWWREGLYAVLGGDPSDASLRELVMALHTGRIGGVATQTIWCLSALAGAMLPLTGYWLWLRRLTRK